MCSDMIQTRRGAEKNTQEKQKSEMNHEILLLAAQDLLRSLASGYSDGGVLMKSCSCASSRAPKTLSFSNISRKQAVS